MKRKIIIYKCTGDVQEHYGRVAELQGYDEHGIPQATIDDGSPMGVMVCHPILFNFVSEE